MTRNVSDVVVVGGGVIGAMSAYYLSLAGCKVTVLDRGRFGYGASHANCGLVCPSHVLPLAEPGAISKALRAMLSRDSPFLIKPRLALSLWAWLVRFALRANRRDMLAAGHAIQSLLHSSAEIYPRLVADAQLDCGWQQRGLLFAYRSPEEMEAYAATDAILREHFDLPARRFDGESLRELEPALKPGLAGGWFYEHEAHLRPDRLMSALRNVLEHHGVLIRENCEVAGFNVYIGSGRATAVATASGSFDADAFVLATGAWTPKLQRMLGCRIGIQPGKGYSVTLPRPKVCPTIPIIFPETRVVATPFESSLRLGSMMEFAGYDTSLKKRRLDLLDAGARPYLADLDCGPAEEQWYGWRPMTSDGIPIIDYAPALRNVLIAAGHNMLGLSMAPATGKLVAEMLCGQPPHLDAALFSLDRKRAWRG